MTLNQKTIEMVASEKEYDETLDETIQRLIRIWRIIKRK